MTTVLRTCHDIADQKKACRFALWCDPERQEEHQKYDPPLEGDACWVFALRSNGVNQSPEQLAAIDGADERLAIRDEAAA